MARFVAIVIAAILAVAATSIADRRGAKQLVTTAEALKLHGDALVMDMRIDTLILVEEIGYDFGIKHNAPLGFIPWMGHVDLPRAYAGGLDAMWLSVVSNPVWGNGPNQVRETMAVAKREIFDKYGTYVTIGTDADAIEDLVRTKKIAVQFHVVGAHALGNDPTAVTDIATEFYQAGMRSMSLSYLTNNEYAASALSSDPNNPGLTRIGRRIVRHLNDLGVVIDLSYAHPKTFRDIAQTSRAPVVVANTGVAAIERSFRNLENWQIRAIAETDGVIGVTFAPQWLSSDMYPPLGVVINHIKHIRKLVGSRHIALGSGFDGFSWLPRGLWDVRDLPKFTVALAKSGFSAEEIRGILGENLLRVMRKVESLRSAP